jgi:hypothetical protein
MLHKLFVNSSILQELNEYCKKYDIPIEYLIDVISDLKVIPMIRGKAFEFSAAAKLKDILSQRAWRVEHLLLNAQQGTHDIDVAVERIKDKKQVKVECKLTKNDSFRIISNDNCELRVKCMRSRTVSDNETATRMAQHYHIPREMILIHADSYRESDFDCVLTSIGNAFWISEESGKYVFNGTREQYAILKRLFPQQFTTFDNFQRETYNFILIACSKDLCVYTMNGIKCTRRKCAIKGTQDNCGFIPNYPIINLKEVAEGRSIWRTIDKAEKLFNMHLS